MPFANRADAGRQLAVPLAHLRRQDVVVLELPSGGVPVAVEVAQRAEVARRADQLRADRPRAALAARLAVVPGAGYLFEKAGTLEQVAELAADWFLGRIATRTQPAQ
jgi:predicted phosphoribosyltransferase